MEKRRNLMETEAEEMLKWTTLAAKKKSWKKNSMARVTLQSQM
jgi:hypothetical protein